MSGRAPATACSIIQKTPTAPAPSNYSGEITSFRRRAAAKANMGPTPPHAFVCAGRNPAPAEALNLDDTTEHMAAHRHGRPAVPGTTVSITGRRGTGSKQWLELTELPFYDCTRHKIYRSFRRRSLRQSLGLIWKTMARGPRYQVFLRHNALLVVFDFRPASREKTLLFTTDHRSIRHPLYGQRLVCMHVRLSRA